MIHLRLVWTAALLSIVITCLVALPVASRAQNLADITSWRVQRVRWFDRGGLPVDNEFTSPMVAQYNWAYGATVLGVTVHRNGGNDYYAALAVYNGNALAALDVLGPFSTQPQFNAGRYHVAVAQPDGRVYAWLTAPGADPRRVLLADDAVPGAPVACLALPPDPPSAKWEQWNVMLAYCSNSDPPYLEVISYTGEGKSTGQIFGLSLPSALNAVSLVGSSGLAPQVLFSVLDTPATSNVNAQVGLYLSSRGANGWYTQRVAGAGSRGVVLHPGVAGSWETAIVMMDATSSGFFMQQLGFATLDSGMQPSMGAYSYFSAQFQPSCISLFESTRSTLPLMAYSDGLDVSLVWRETQRGHEGSLLGISSLVLHQGETSTQRSAIYPVLAVAGTAHWSTGNPEVYWVQQGSVDNSTGQLFRYAFDYKGK
jgi:hypothetical protein